jgi:hypothetical protein
MNKRDRSESDICAKCITPAVIQAGWDETTQIGREVSFTKGRIILRGEPVTRGQPRRAEYVLFYHHMPRAHASFASLDAATPPGDRATAQSGPFGQVRSGARAALRPTAQRAPGLGK